MASQQKHTTHTENIKHSHHGPPSLRLSEAPTYRWVQSLYVTRSITIIATRRCTVYWWHYLFFYLLNCYSMFSSSARSLTKGEFLKVYLVMFLCRCIETTCTNPSYPAIPYLAMSPENSSCFGLILDRRGRCHCHNVFSKVEVGSVVVSIALLHNIIVNKCLGKNT